MRGVVTVEVGVYGCCDGAGVTPFGGGTVGVSSTWTLAGAAEVLGLDVPVFCLVVVDVENVLLLSQVRLLAESAVREPTTLSSDSIREGNAETML